MIIGKAHLEVAKLNGLLPAAGHMCVHLHCAVACRK